MGTCNFLSRTNFATKLLPNQSLKGFLKKCSGGYAPDLPSDPCFVRNPVYHSLLNEMLVSDERKVACNLTQSSSLELSVFYH